jgi:hypothetical protein
METLFSVPLTGECGRFGTVDHAKSDLVCARYIADLYRKRCDADMRGCYGISTGGDAKDKVGCLCFVPAAL